MSLLKLATLIMGSMTICSCLMFHNKMFKQNSANVKKNNFTFLKRDKLLIYNIASFQIIFVQGVIYTVQYPPWTVFLHSLLQYFFVSENTLSALFICDFLSCPYIFFYPFLFNPISPALFFGHIKRCKDDMGEDEQTGWLGKTKENYLRR